MRLRSRHQLLRTTEPKRSLPLINEAARNLVATEEWSFQEEYSTIRQLTVDANNFKLKPALITMVQQHQFTGHPTEDPNEYLGRFLRMENTVKLNGVRP